MAAATACASTALAGRSLLQLQNELVRKEGAVKWTTGAIRSQRSVQRPASGSESKR